MNAFVSKIHFFYRLILFIIFWGCFSDLKFSRTSPLRFSGKSGQTGWWFQCSSCSCSVPSPKQSWPVSGSFTGLRVGSLTERECSSLWFLTLCCSRKLQHTVHRDESPSSQRCLVQFSRCTCLGLWWVRVWHWPWLCCRFWHSLEGRWRCWSLVFLCWFRCRCSCVKSKHRRQFDTWRLRTICLRSCWLNSLKGLAGCCKKRWGLWL